MVNKYFTLSEYHLDILHFKAIGDVLLAARQIFKINLKRLKGKFMSVPTFWHGAV